MCVCVCVLVVHIVMTHKYAEAQRDGVFICFILNTQVFVECMNVW